MAPGLLVGEEVPRRLVDWAQVLPCVFQKPAGVVLHQQLALGADAVVGDAADPFFASPRTDLPSARWSGFGSTRPARSWS